LTTLGAVLKIALDTQAKVTANVRDATQMMASGVTTQTTNLSMEPNPDGFGAYGAAE
jgi:hypothetical protein